MTHPYGREVEAAMFEFLFLRQQRLGAPASKDLLDFFFIEPTRLSAVIDRLVYLETAAA